LFKISHIIRSLSIALKDVNKMQNKKNEFYDDSDNLQLKTKAV